MPIIFIFIFLIAQKVMYQQKDLTSITESIHVKYQSSSTNCLNVISQVKVSDRMTEKQITEIPVVLY